MRRSLALLAAVAGCSSSAPNEEAISVTAGLTPEGQGFVQNCAPTVAFTVTE